jgi:hypothetical protein
MPLGDSTQSGADPMPGRRSEAACPCCKSDPIDAHLAALHAQRLDADRLPTPRADSDREALRILLGARRELTTARTRTINRLRESLLTGSDADRALSRGALTPELAAITRRRGVSTRPANTRSGAPRPAASPSPPAGSTENSPITSVTSSTWSPTCATTAGQTPREPSIRCCRWQSITLRLVLTVACPNRGEGDLRARVGLSAVPRTGGQVLLFAIEPPDDDTQLIVGMEKANAPPAHRQPSIGKCHAITRSCPRGLGGRRDHRPTQIDDPTMA